LSAIAAVLGCRHCSEICFLVFSLGLFPVGVGSGAETERRTDPESGLASWRLVFEELSLELVQRLPDQTRAFFLARGFGAPEVERIATSCVFQSIIGNAAQGPGGAEIKLDLSRWRVVSSGGEGGLRLREDWEAAWAGTEVSEAARIALQWSLFPTLQRFRPGDYNWGMISFGLPPGTRFELELRWRRDDEERSARLAGIECPRDLHPAADGGAAGRRALPE
jgi:hypothetical protein